ncbi:hypothetical protein JW960_13090 [candidate division KSB1 bacterium]|nr:hypothetical protein [candidate division KSB1 bacterium]
MPVTFRCKHCQQNKPINPKRKGNQTYCSDPACQRARKAAWQKQRMAHDDDYCISQRTAVRQWRKNKPDHDYQAQYRKNHADDAERNRMQQQLRNQKRSKNSLGEMDPTIDALPINESDIYKLTPIKSDDAGKIVKMDVLLLTINASRIIRYLSA